MRNVHVNLVEIPAIDVTQRRFTPSWDSVWQRINSARLNDTAKLELLGKSDRCLELIGGIQPLAIEIGVVLIGPTNLNQLVCASSGANAGNARTTHKSASVFHAIRKLSTANHDIILSHSRRRNGDRSSEGKGCEVEEVKVLMARRIDEVCDFAIHIPGTEGRHPLIVDGSRLTQKQSSSRSSDTGFLEDARQRRKGSPIENE